MGTRVGAGLGVDVGAGEARGEGTGVGAGGRECDKGEGKREGTVPQRSPHSTAAGAAALLHLAPGPNPDYNAGGLTIKLRGSLRARYWDLDSLRARRSLGGASEGTASERPRDEAAPR